MAGKRKVKSETFKAVEGFSCNGIKWDGIKLSQTRGIEYAIVTVGAISFDFTSEGDLVFMADGADTYTVNELLGTLKKYGNYSDFADSRRIVPTVDINLDPTSEEELRSAITSVPTFYRNLCAKAQAKVDSMDWNDAADKLIPFAKAIQTLFAYTEK